MKWLSISKWRNCTSPSAVDLDKSFRSTSGELTDAPWSPTSCDRRSTSSFSSGSSVSPTGSRSFVKRIFAFTRMGREDGALPRGGRKKQNPYGDGQVVDSGSELAYNPEQEEDYDDYSSEDFTQTSLWQRNILLGEKCEAPAFSGLILYDTSGNQINQLPAKSPLHPALTAALN